MFLLCHPWFTTTNLSYTFPIFETSATASCGSTGMSTYLVFFSIERCRCFFSVVKRFCVGTSFNRIKTKPTHLSLPLLLGMGPTPGILHYLTLPKLNSSPLNSYLCQKERLVFQPPFFLGANCETSGVYLLSIGISHVFFSSRLTSVDADDLPFW